MAPETPVPRAARRFLRGTWRLTAALLAVWAAVTFGVAFFARDLSFELFGWPFSFWVGSQGALIVYVLIVVVYAWAMNRREKEAAELPPDLSAQPERADRGGRISGF